MDTYQMDPAAALLELNSNAKTGLSREDATRRLASYGRNELTGSGVRSPWRIIWEQLTALMMLILIVAAVISAALGDDKDAIAIGTIVILNAVLGFSQEYRAEKAMASLRKLAVPSVKVRRDGEVQEIPAFLLVPGDVILIEAGNLVAADSRLLECASLQAHEATLTGESEPIHKITQAIPAAGLAIGDRRNMLYMGTFVTAGRGIALVTATGMRSELGRIATLLHNVGHQPTPLQLRLAGLGKWLAAAALALVLTICALGLLRGENPGLVFLTAVSIGVAAVPEGLPAVVTIALTLGAQRMLKRRVLIRRLPSVETLGSVTVICTDKTGTLTENRMTAAVLQLPEAKLTLDPNQSALSADHIQYDLLVSGGSLCNDATSSHLGDPTETALIAAAERFGWLKPELDLAMPRVAEAPFSSERKMMTTVHRFAVGVSMQALPDGIASVGAGLPFLACTKGAAGSLLARSGAVWIDGKPQPLTPAWRQHLNRADDDLARNGMRVLGIAFRGLETVPDTNDPSLEQDLTFVGMVGILDPPRTEARAAVEKCRAAGIRAVMITGDHPATARSVASQVGIDAGNRIITGPELDQMSVQELEGISETVQVYSRVSPEHKLKIVEALQHRGHTVAMTGDGVNDAPALKKANIGVAMGITGTDVAREAADMVLLDDNFATIVSAVEEGRVIYTNTRKFIRYILATNSAEIWVMLAAPLFGMPLPLLPLQILWMNLVTDGLPALALGAEPAEPDTMRRPPHHPKESVFSRGLGRHVIWVGILMGSLSLAAGWRYWRIKDPSWQTMLFTALTLSQMAHILAIRSERYFSFQRNVPSNLPLLGAVALTVSLQLALVYVPYLHPIFNTTPLSVPQMILTAALGLTVFAAVELEKLVLRMQKPASFGR
ncbi:MAG TPA: cation-translocating P-type ATPase [Bryobacteraceae bacterium]|nr:cation-translocating P-type ATPase [Bryobacteraceae bacterium]